MRKLTILFALLTLSVGLWAQDAPAGQIIYEGLLFRNVTTCCVELVTNKDAASPYSGDIVVPEGFEFTDSQGKQYHLDVVQIGSEAFADCPDLISVTLPATIGWIKDGAFANSPKLESVTCLGTIPALIGENVFSDEMETVIYVPRVAKAAYKADWSAYADRITLADLDAAKEEAIAEITNARQGIINAELNALIDDAISAINNATTQVQITEREHEIFIIMGMYQTGKAEAKTELLGTMGTEAPGTAVEVTNGETTVILYKPTKVSYKKVE